MGSSKAHFKIERHGGAVNGSVWAEMQIWTVDVEAKSATLENSYNPKKRLIRTLDKRVDVKPIAEELASIVLKHETDPRVIWYGESEFRLDIAKVVGGNSKQTALGRRHRFRTAFNTLISPHGWQAKRPNLPNRFIRVES